MQGIVVPRAISARFCAIVAVFVLAACGGSPAAPRPAAAPFEVAVGAFADSVTTGCTVTVQIAGNTGPGWSITVHVDSPGFAADTIWVTEGAGRYRAQSSANGTAQWSNVQFTADVPGRYITEC